MQLEKVPTTFFRSKGVILDRARPGKRAAPLGVGHLATIDQTLLLQAIAMALAKYPSDNAADLSGRAVLIGPILRQNEAIGQYLKSRRMVPDVNPETGEKVPVPSK